MPHKLVWSARKCNEGQLTRLGWRARAYTIPWPAWQHTIGANKKPIHFGALRIGKNYVSYYFMPVYGGISEGLTPALKKRMRGRARFNFKEVDEALFKDLRVLTKRGYYGWKKMKWVE